MPDSRKNAGRNKRADQDKPDPRFAASACDDLLAELVRELARFCAESDHEESRTMKKQVARRNGGKKDSQ